MVCRSVVFVGLGTFISFYAARCSPGGEVAGTAALFVLCLGGAAGTPAGGRLATRYGRVRVVRWSYTLTVLAVAGVVLVPGPPLHLFVALASAVLYVPFSPHITPGRDYPPARVGTAGGVTLGLTAGVGGLASPLVRRLADATALRTALLPLIVSCPPSAASSCAACESRPRPARDDRHRPRGSCSGHRRTQVPDVNAPAGSAIAVVVALLEGLGK